MFFLFIQYLLLFRTTKAGTFYSSVASLLSSHGPVNGAACLDCLLRPLFVLDDYGGVRTLNRNGQASLFQKSQMLFHAPSRLIQAILDGMPYAGEPLKVRRIKSKEGGIVCSFDHQRVLEIDHATPLDA